MLSNRVRLWRAMRQLRRFDLRQLQIATATTRHAAWDFARALHRTGFLVKRGSTLVLVRDNGPKPPMLLIQRAGKVLLGVLDRNTGERWGADGQPAPPPRTEPAREPRPPKYEPRPRNTWHPRWRKRRKSGGAT